MRAFHNDAELKKKLLVQIAWHREQDKLVKGTYGSEFKNGDFRGCAVGCSIHSLALIHGRKLNTGDHRILAKELDAPVELFHLQDAFFEGLPQDRAMAWPEQFTEAIPVGADLSMVIPQFFYWLLSDEKDGVINLVDAKEFPDVHRCVTSAASLQGRLMRGEIIANSERAARAAEAARAAWAAEAARAARAAEAARAARAAWAAWAAEAARAAEAAEAAWAAEAARAARAARAAWAARAARAAEAAEAARAAEAAETERIRILQAEKLLELLRAAPVVAEEVEA